MKVGCDRNHIKENMSILVQNPETFRANIANNLYKDLFQSKTTESDARRLSTALEESIYKFAEKESLLAKVSPVWENASFVTLYTCRFRSLYLNLTKETAFLDQLVSGAIPESQFVHIQHVDISQKKWMPYIQRLMEREKYAQEKVQETSDMFVCPKCENSHTTHYSLQTRGGDEPMTIFINCIDCDHKWTE
jgi:DNA-directed RNA polymerase subunit M/transcription elongation factor TFIIS